MLCGLLWPYEAVEARTGTSCSMAAHSPQSLPNGPSEMPSVMSGKVERLKWAIALRYSVKSNSAHNLLLQGDLLLPAPYKLCV